MKARDFLSKEEQAQVVASIKEAELNTSGEIRIHLDEECSTDPMECAVSVFKYLKMEETEQRNAVLIYVACESSVFSIIGDEGINNVVPENFWSDVSLIMGQNFSKGSFANGLCEAVKLVGIKLKEYFPYQSDDINEQPDEISFNKE